MKRTSIYLGEEQIEFLKTRRGTMSDHIRYALDTYINMIRKDELKKVSASASVRKGGE